MKARIMLTVQLLLITTTSITVLASFAAPTDNEGSKCPPGLSHVYCFDDPCKIATCPKHPDAKCIPNFCGGCNAKFFDSEENEVTDTCKAKCPPGESAVICYDNPCQVATCPKHPDAKCVDSYCGGCKAHFFDSEGNNVTDTCRDPCSGVYCNAGSVCKVYGPTGQPFCESSCEVDNGGCDADQACVLMNVQCTNLPCSPVVSCQDCAKACSIRFCQDNPNSNCTLPPGSPVEIPGCSGPCDETYCSLCQLQDDPSAMPLSGIRVEGNFLCERPQCPLRG